MLGLALLVTGGILIATAVLTGGAHVAWVVVVPILYGSSFLFLGGTLLVLVGLLLGATVTVPPEEAPSDRAPQATGSDGEGSGGVLLLGPVPIFFGRWGNRARVHYWRWVLLGVLAFLAFVVGAILVGRGV